MALRYIDGIQVLNAGKLIRTIDRRPLRVLPNSSLGVTFEGLVYQMQHRQIELTAGAWRKIDTKLLLAGVAHSGIDAAISPTVPPPTIRVEIGDRVWFMMLGTAKIDQVLIAANCDVPLVRIASARSPVGESLLGRSKGEVVTVRTPREAYDAVIFRIDKMAVWDAA